MTVRLSLKEKGRSGFRNEHTADCPHEVGLKICEANQVPSVHALHLPNRSQDESSKGATFCGG